MVGGLCSSGCGRLFKESLVGAQVSVASRSFKLQALTIAKAETGFGILKYPKAFYNPDGSESPWMDHFNCSIPILEGDGDIFILALSRK